MFLGTGKNNWPIADRLVPNNNPRNNCGIHIGSSSLLVSKVAKNDKVNKLGKSKTGIYLANLSDVSQFANTNHFQGIKEK